MIARLSVAALAVVIVVTGCRAHAVLEELPPPSAPVDVRAAAYERAKPTLLVSPCRRCSRQQQQSLRLGDGTIVEDPLDLALLVNANGATLVHANNARALDDVGLGLHIGAVGVMTVGLAGMLGGFAMVAADDSSGHAVVALSSLFSSFGGAAMLVPAMLVKADAERERVAAFHTYEGELRARLALVRTKESLVARWEASSVAPGVTTSTPPSFTDPVD